MLRQVSSSTSLCRSAEPNVPHTNKTATKVKILNELEIKLALLLLDWIADVVYTDIFLEWANKIS